MRKLITSLSFAALAAMASTALASATVGEPAPDFNATATDGKTVRLSDFKGRHVVLEWVNPGCPYVRKHYGAKNMQATQQAALSAGAVWLSVNSTTPDHGDYLSPSQLAAWMQGQGAAPTATLMDEDGRVGRAYGARTTPHMYIVDPKGTLVYAGAIDSKPSANPADIPGATNHVKVALSESMAGKAVSTPATRAYGCTVKYGSSGE